MHTSRRRFVLTPRILAQATLISEIDHLSLKYREQKGLVFHCSFISRWQVRGLQLVVAVQADRDPHALILGLHSHGFTMQPPGALEPLHLPQGGEPLVRTSPLSQVVMAAEQVLLHLQRRQDDQADRDLQTLNAQCQFGQSAVDRPRMMPTIPHR